MATASPIMSRNSAVRSWASRLVAVTMTTTDFSAIALATHDRASSMAEMCSRGSPTEARTPWSFGDCSANCTTPAKGGHPIPSDASFPSGLRAGTRAASDADASDEGMGVWAEVCVMRLIVMGSLAAECRGY